MFATMFLHSWFPLIWYATWPCSKKSLILTFWPHPLGSWGRGRVCGQNICYHVAAFVIPFNLICNMTLFWKSKTLTFWPLGSGTCVWGGVCGENICYHVCYISWFQVIWYATWLRSEKVEFWPVNRIPRVGGQGDLWTKYLVPCYCICDSNKFDVLKRMLTLWPHPLWSQGRGGGGSSGKHLLPCCCILWFP